MILILLGPPGAGKGSQAKRIIQDFGVAYISTGDIFRKNIKEETELGLKVKEIISNGELVSDELTNNLVIDKISSEEFKNGFMLDGWPRNINQAEALDKWLKDTNNDLTEVIYIDADTEVLIKRISGRRVCKNCGSTYHVTNFPPKKEGICDVCGSELIQRSDDNEETARQRIEVYEQQTSPLIDYYTEKEKLHRYDGNLEIDDVYKEIKKSLK